MMKKVILVIFCTCLVIPAYAINTLNYRSDSQHIHLNLENASIKEVFQHIERQTFKKFIFQSDQKIFDQTISITTNDASLEGTLEILRSKINLDFKILERGILVKTTDTDSDVSYQQGILNGTVFDESGVPIPGATVMVLDTEYGAVTDFDGNFTLRTQDITYPLDLKISFMGYRAKFVQLDQPQSNLQIIMEASSESLDEVVITGQGADVRKKRLPTNVVTIGEDDLERISSQRIDQKLAAELPNAQINLTGGQAGATSIIRARGVNSAFLSSTPIIYLDGVRMDNLNTQMQLGGTSQGSAISAIADIPMDNIEKIEYINGGAATTLYGSDAANGVIQIFTKKGGKSGTNFTVEAQSGVETPTTDFLYFDRTKDLLFKNGLYQKYRLNVNGKSDGGFGYTFSGSFRNSSGVQIHNQNENLKADFTTGFSAPP